MPSPADDLRKIAEGDEILAAEHDATAAMLRAHAAEFRLRADKIDAGIILTTRTQRTYIRHTMQELQTAIGRKVGRPIESEHLFPAWLRSRNVTVTEWAAGHNDPDTGKPYKRERVKSWFAEGEGARPAPRHAVDIIEKESTDPKTKKAAVPATKRTWKNGIRE